MATMKAAVIYEAGGPEVLRLEARPVPMPKRGEVLIRGQGLRSQPVGTVHPAGALCRT